MKNKYLLFLLLTFTFLQSRAQNAPIAEVTIDTPGAICQPGDCTALNAQYFETRATTNYSMSSIAYQNLYPYTGGTKLDANADDTWSPTYNLPFPICFYGVKYNQVLIGSNGLITFGIVGNVPGGTETSGGYCAWNLNGAPNIPNAGFPIKNAIYGVYQDTNIGAPPVTDPVIQNVNYYVGGTFPNRFFVANFNELPQFSCNAGVGFQTSQIVIYETTNIIDVYVKKRTFCSGWNSGIGIIGIQNQSGSLGMAAPGRNTTSPSWNTTNEAWRFTPNGAVQSTFHWEHNGVDIGNTNPLPVCTTDPLNPVDLGIYTAVVEYKLCDGLLYATVDDSIDVQLADDLPVSSPLDIEVCQQVPFNQDINQDAFILSTAADPTGYDITYYDTSYQNAFDGVPNNIAYATTFAYPVTAVPTTIWVRIQDLYVTGCFNVRQFDIIPSTGASGTFTYAQPSYCRSQTGVVAVTPSTPPLPATTTYAATPAGLTINATNGSITPSTSAVGNYTVTATVPANAPCPAYSTTTLVEIKDCTCTATASNSTTVTPICKDGTFSLTSTNSVASSTFAWTGPGGYTSSAQNPTGISVPAGAGPFTYTVTATTPTGDTCTNSTTLTITPNPTIALTSAAGSNVQTVCVNTAMSPTIQYTITNATGATAAPLPPGITATFAAGVLTISGTPTTAAATLNYTVTTTGGCAAFPATATGSITVANQTIALTSPAATQTQSVCINSNIVNTVYTVGAQANGATVTALPAGVTGVFSGSNFTVSGSPTATGIFNYTITTTSSTVSCAGATISGTITVNALPTVTVTTTTPCSGSASTVTAVPGDGMAYTYVWTVPSGAANPGSVNTFTTLTAGVYSVVITNSVTNCVSVSASGTVTINPLPTVTVASSPISICGGQSATVTATPGIAGTYTYAWTVPAGATNPGSIPSFSTTTTGTYSVTITNTVTTCVSAPASVTINASPAPTVVTSSTSPCVGTSATVSAVASPAGTYTYVWTVPTGVADPGSVASFTTTVAGAYSVVATNTTTTCPSASVTENVSFKPIPTLTIADANACQGSPATLTAVPGNSNAYNIAWTVPTGVTNPGNVLSFTTTTAGSYSAIITDALSGCSSIAATATVVINPLPTGTVTGPTFCEGDSTTVTATPTVAGTYSYAWTVPTGVTNPGSVPSFTTTVAGNYSVIITNTATGCVSAPIAKVVNVNPKPIVSLAGSAVCQGQNATLTAVPNVAGSYTYSWIVPTGATNPGDVATFQTMIDGDYSVIITNTTTTCVSVSATARITVNPLPTVTVTAPPVCSGTSATVTALPGTSGTYNYAWTVPAGAAAPGSVNSFTTTVAGNYSVIITDTVTTCSSLSASGTVIINALPTVTVAGQTVCGGNASVTATPGVAGPYTYAWTVPAGATNPGSVATFSTAVSGIYSVIITNTTTTCSSASASGTVTINPLPTVTVSAPPICAGAASTVLATPGSGTAAQYSYVWTVPTGAANPGNVPSFNTTVAGNYSVVITAIATGCSSASASVTVVVNPVPVAVVTTANMTLCSGGTTSIAISSTTPATTFSWTIASSSGVTGFSAGTGNNIAQTLTTTGNTNGSVTYSVVPTANGCTGTAQNITIAVVRLPAVTLPTGPIGICSGETTNIPVSSNIAGTTYLVDVLSPNVSGATGAINSAGFIKDVLVATGTNGGQVVYTVTPVNGGCPGPSKSITVNVSPIPTAVATGPLAVCSGQKTNIIISDPVTAMTTFTWTAAATIGVSGASASAVPSSVIAQTLTTIGSTPGTVTYTITPTSNSCVGVPIEVTVTVNPRPTAPGNSNPAPICSGNSIVVPILPGIAGTTYSWTIGTVNGVSGASAGSGFTIDQILATTDNAVGTVQYIIEPKLGDCTGPTATITVTVYPSPVVNINDGIICVDQDGNNTTTYTFTTGLSTAQYSFSWFLDGVDLNSSDSSYEAGIPGVYTVRVKNNTTNCINEDSATLTSSTGPQIVTVSPVQYFNDDQVISINVIPAGEYEYQIDNGLFQSSNQFANLGGGSHTVVVRNICDRKPVTFTVITYPKFFTPNGDGYNDYWNIYDLKDQAQSRIYIFDRYGKLIKEMSPQGQGWDGKFNQQLLPGTDYWFKVMYDENGAQREFKSHFSLKR